MNTHDLMTIQSLLNDCAEAELDYDIHLYILAQFLSRDIYDMTTLTQAEWRVIRNSAFPYWRDGDWNVVNPTFKAQVVHFLSRYREEILSQQRMF